MITYKLADEDETPTRRELAYIALNGGELWECIGETSDGHIDTAYGNSEADALERAVLAGLR